MLQPTGLHGAERIGLRTEQCPDPDRFCAGGVGDDDRLDFQPHERVAGIAHVLGATGVDLQQSGIRVCRGDEVEQGGDFALWHITQPPLIQTSERTGSRSGSGA